MNTSIFYNIQWFAAFFWLMVACGPKDETPTKPANENNCEAIVISDLEKRYYLPAQMGWQYIYRVHEDSSVLRIAPDYPIPFEDTLKTVRAKLDYDSSKVTSCFPYHTSSTYYIRLQANQIRTIPIGNEGEIAASIYRMEHFYYALAQNNGIMQIGLYGGDARLRDYGNGRWAVVILDDMNAPHIPVQMDTLASHTVLGQQYAKVVRFSWPEHTLYFAPDVGLIEAIKNSSYVCQLVDLKK